MGIVQWRFLNKNQGEGEGEGEVLNLPSTLQVVQYLSSIGRVCAFHKKKASKNIDTMEKAGFLIEKASI